VRMPEPALPRTSKLVRATEEGYSPWDEETQAHRTTDK